MTQASLLKEEIKGFSQRVVEELSALKGEADWLLRRRLAAWAVYEATPMPTLSDEDWRRTPISHIPFGELQPYKAPPAAVLADLDQVAPGLRPWVASGEAHAGHIIVHDSEAVYTELAEAAHAEGIIFAPLEEASRQWPERMQPHLLGEAFPAARGKFASLNAALFSGGTFLYVPAGVELALPLRITHWLEAPGLAAFPHTVIVLDEGAHASLIHEYLSAKLEGPCLVCPGIEVYLQPGARLDYISIQELDSSVFLLGHQRSLLARDSHLEHMAIALGGRLSKSYVDSLLVGEGASARMLGVLFADGDQHFDHQTLQEHVAPNGTSELLFKVAVKDRAMSVHYGLVHVGKAARGTNAGQTVRNLILSDGAKAHPILPLEIEASDIKRCSHAAAIGQIDENQLFYLMSRGLSRRQAEKLVVDGFFEPLMEQIPLEAVRERLRRAIDAKLPPD